METCLSILVAWGGLLDAVLLLWFGKLLWDAGWGTGYWLVAVKCLHDVPWECLVSLVVADFHLGAGLAFLSAGLVVLGVGLVCLR